MQYILSIMTQAKTPLPLGLEAQVQNVLNELKLKSNSPRWLSPNLAFEVAFEANFEAKEQEDKLKAALKAALKSAFSTPNSSTIAADINILPAPPPNDPPNDPKSHPSQNRRKKLLMADMDSTIITSESLNDLAALAGVEAQVAQITAQAMQGKLDFAQALKERLKIIKGQPENLLKTIIQNARLTDGAETLIATMKPHAHTILASGGFTFLTSVIAERLGFDAHHANQLVVENGRITGTVHPPIVDQAAKANLLTAAMARLGLSAQEVATVGDGANDRSMTQIAAQSQSTGKSTGQSIGQGTGLGIAFRGKDALKAVANAHLDHADLRGVLWLQGYHDDEFM